VGFFYFFIFNRSATSNMQLQQPVISTSNQQQSASSKQPPTSVKFLFWLYCLFVIYGTALPFHPDLTQSGLRYRWKHAELVPFLNSQGHRLSLGDAVGNILFFVPFGFFLHSWRQARRFQTIARSQDQIGISLTLLAALLFSGTIECGQLFLDGRTTSINDVMTNLLGAFIGARLAVAYPGLVARTLEALKRMARLRPFLALWLATIAVQTLIALAPFDFTLKMENFQRQWLRWQYSWQELRSIGQIHSVAGSWLQDFPHRERMLASLLGTSCCALLLGALTIWCWRHYWLHSVRFFWGLTSALLGFYPALAVLQFAVQSIHPYPFFPIVGILGVIAGMLLMAALLQLALWLPAWRES
jgi:glycopeptide antibiotics resistance protein